MQALLTLKDEKDEILFLLKNTNKIICFLIS